MKIGVPTFYEFNTLEENLEFAKLVNADFIELNLNFPYIKKAIYEENLKTKELLEKYNLESTVHFYDEGDFASLEVANTYIELFKTACKCSNIVGAKNINIHLNLGGVVTINGVKNYIYAKEYEDFYKRLENNLSIIDSYAKEYNLQLVIENVIGNDWINETLKKLSEKYSFTYDIGHDYTTGSHLKDFYFKTKNIKEFHIHDSNGSKDHLELGKGTMNLKEYFNLVSDQYCLIEVKETKAYLESIKYIKEMQ